jgi:hypothetical protein
MRRMLAVMGLVILVASACGGSGTKMVTVAPSPSGGTAAVTTTSEGGVEAVDYGFTQRKREVSYGIVLRNTSTEDAVGVSAVANLEDDSGLILASPQEVVFLIPAGATFYVGGDDLVNAQVARLEPTVSVGSMEAASEILPIIRDVRLARDSSGGLAVRGEVKNNQEESLASYAEISAVVLDAKGRIVGGGYTFLHAPLQPGRRAAFETTNGLEAVRPSSVTNAKASINYEFVHD